jgi:hypothetical protein
MLLLLDHTRENLFKRWDGSMDPEETSEISVQDALLFTEITIITTDMFTGPNATIISVQLGTLTEEESDIQSNHLLQVSNSKLDQNIPGTELSTGPNTGSEDNTTWESKTTTQMTRDNGSHSTLELKLSELSIEEDTQLPKDMDMDQDSSVVNTLSSRSTLDTTLKRSNGTQAQEETLEITETCALMPNLTITVDTSHTTDAIMELTKPGSLTKDGTAMLDNHMETQENSRSDPRCQEEELSDGGTTSVVINTTLNCKIILHSWPINGGLLITEPSPSEPSQRETMHSPISSTTNIDKTTMLTSDHGETSHIKRFSSEDQELSTMLTSVWCQRMEETPTRTTSLSGCAKWVALTRDGSLTLEEFTSQDIHWEMVLDSKSNLKWELTKLFSTMNTLELTTIDLESETTIQKTSNNGGCSTGEPDLSELKETEQWPFLSNGTTTTGTETDTLLLLLDTPESTSKESDGSMDPERTSEMSVLDASTLLEDQTLTTDTCLGTDAKMDNGKHGRLIPRESHTQDIQSEMESNSRSEPEWPPRDQSELGLTAMPESLITIHTIDINGGSSTGDLRPSDLLLTEDMFFQLTTVSTKELMLRLDLSESNQLNTCNGTRELEETLDTTEVFAWMSEETKTPIINTSGTIDATMVLTKLGS